MGVRGRGWRSEGDPCRLRLRAGLSPQHRRANTDSTSGVSPKSDSLPSYAGPRCLGGQSPCGRTVQGDVAIFIALVMPPCHLFIYLFLLSPSHVILARPDLMVKITAENVGTAGKEP